MPDNDVVLGNSDENENEKSSDGLPPMKSFKGGKKPAPPGSYPALPASIPVPPAAPDPAEKLIAMIRDMTPEQLKVFESRVLVPQPVQTLAPDVIPEGAEAKPADVAKIPTSTKIHWTKLYPQAAAIDPRTGKPRPRRDRKGGQFSARRITLVNAYDPTRSRTAIVPVHEDSRNWQVDEFERVSENVEIIFDFEDELAEFMKAMGLKRKDPLAMNDGGSAFDIASGKISPPPGGFPTP